MTYTFDIPIDLVFFLFFVGGFISGVLTLVMCIDYARRREKYFEEHNCMGIRKPTPGRPAPPKPPHNPHK